MEPLFDKLARQGFVKKLITTIRDADKRSDKWMLSRQPQFRIALAALMVLIAASMGLIIAFGIAAMFAICLILYFFNYVFLLVNFCLIVTARQSTAFKWVNLGIFVVYLVPLAVSFLNSEFFDHFPLAIFLFPVAAFLHFLHLIFAWQRIRESAARKAVKFVISMLVMSVICSIVWESVVAENLYNDTDDNMLGFLSPGGWVSNWDGQHPIVQVDHIVHTGSMGDPDTIKRGWTVTDLWLLWFGFIAISVVLSVGLAWLPWMPRRISVP